jgi:hypothetical protein
VNIFQDIGVPTSVSAEVNSFKQPIPGSLVFLGDTPSNDTNTYYGIYTASIPTLLEVHPEPKPNTTITNVEKSKKPKGKKSKVASVEAEAEKQLLTYNLYELSKFGEALSKGDLFAVINTVIKRPSAAWRIAYAHPLWDELATNKEDLMTNGFMNQCVGYISHTLIKLRGTQPSALFSVVDRTILELVVESTCQCLQAMQENAADDDPLLTVIQELHLTCSAALNALTAATASDLINVNEVVELLQKFDAKSAVLRPFTKYLPDGITASWFSSWFLRIRMYQYSAVN